MQQRDVAARRVHVASRATPHSEQRVRRRARLRRPRGAVVVPDGAGVAYREHIARRAAPHADQRIAGPARLRGPVGAVVVQDRAAITHGEHVAP